MSSTALRVGFLLTLAVPFTAACTQALDSSITGTPPAAGDSQAGPSSSSSGSSSAAGSSSGSGSSSGGARGE
ncbi:MAG: hypothetical protein JOZ69_21420, partial [Myxococcales bacterium]|nr:hypothetical protein [Myxococcales bacterium]